MGAITSDRCLIGATSSSMAVMKATKLPTDAPPLPACHSASVITPTARTAASICVTGVMVAPATTDFSSSRRSAVGAVEKAPACPRLAPCRRTMRQASTFSSTT
jgi:hypothetical protein